MWNIRSHARRFPVHTGTLTPSIAHPNRFLNHLKRFSAGFLTFRGGKIKNCTVSGDKTNDFECAPGSWLVLSVKPCRACQLSQRESPWHNGKVSGQTITLSGFARGSLFEGTVAQRLRGFQSAEHKKSFSEATWIFCMEPNSFGVTRGEQPLVRASRASKVAGTFLVLFWCAKENLAQRKSALTFSPLPSAPDSRAEYAAAPYSPP